MNILRKYWLARVFGLWTLVFAMAPAGITLAMITILQRTGTRMEFSAIFRVELVWAYAILATLVLAAALFVDPKLRFQKLSQPT